MQFGNLLYLQFAYQLSSFTFNVDVPVEHLRDDHTIVRTFSRIQGRVFYFKRQYDDDNEGYIETHPDWSQRLAKDVANWYTYYKLRTHTNIRLVIGIGMVASWRTAHPKPSGLSSQINQETTTRYAHKHRLSG